MKNHIQFIFIIGLFFPILFSGCVSQDSTTLIKENVTNVLTIEYGDPNPIHTVKGLYFEQHLTIKNTENLTLKNIEILLIGQPEDSVRCPYVQETIIVPELLPFNNNETTITFKNTKKPTSVSCKYKWTFSANAFIIK